jgi:hypothetical protein
MSLAMMVVGMFLRKGPIFSLGLFVGRRILRPRHFWRLYLSSTSSTSFLITSFRVTGVVADSAYS